MTIVLQQIRILAFFFVLPKDLFVLLREWTSLVVISCTKNEKRIGLYSISPISLPESSDLTLLSFLLKEFLQ